MSPLTNNIESVVVAYSTQPPVYYPGQVVSGVVNLVLKEATEMSFLRLDFEGKAHVQWSQRRNKRAHRYQNDRTYFALMAILWGSPEATTAVISAGNYSFPFQFNLPPNIPVSYERGDPSVPPIAYIRYLCRISIDNQLNIDAPFSVVSIYDLNMKQYARQLIQTSNSISPTVGCCSRSGPVTITLNGPKSGFIVGEEVLLQAKVSNLSSNKVTSTQVDLIQEVTFYGSETIWGHINQNQFQAKHVCATARDDNEIEARKTTNITFKLTIPPILSSDLLFCDIININYKICLSIQREWTLRTLVAESPIVIGNIQLQPAIGESQQNVLAPSPPTYDAAIMVAQ